LPTPQQLYKHGLEHLNISIDYWQRALTIISLSLPNPPNETVNQNHLIQLKQKLEFLLNKIDVNSNANELAVLLEQEQEQQLDSLPLTNSSIDNSLIVLNRSDSNRVQQELQTVLSVQSDLNTFNDRRSLRSIRSTDSFESCPDVNIKTIHRFIVLCKKTKLFFYRMQNGLIQVILYLIQHHHIIPCHLITSMDFV